MRHLKICALVFCATNLTWTIEGHARPSEEYQKTAGICASTVRIQERRDAIPLHLLSAISQAESGRWDEEKQANIAWPWTVTSGGTGKFFNTKMEAVAEVEFLMTNGVRNIDIGCMQINLAAHSNAFETLEHAFDPIANVAYGAKYLKIMHQRTGNWLEAAGGYHSMTPNISAKYRAKIKHIWNKLLGIQRQTKKSAGAKPAANIASEYPTSTIDYARLNQLNENFRQRISLTTESANRNPVTRRSNKRMKQISAWRKSRSRGKDLGALANIRQEEQARQRKRESETFRKGDHQLTFANRRRQQLNFWRNRKIRDLAKN